MLSLFYNGHHTSDLLYLNLILELFESYVFQRSGLLSLLHKQGLDSENSWQTKVLTWQCIVLNLNLNLILVLELAL